jgi:uncharacterized paraquat-inducible protein A
VLLNGGLAFDRASRHIRGMEQDIIKPQSTPKAGKQAFSSLGCFLAAAGATLLTLTLLGAAAAASAWAFAKLMGFPDSIFYALLVLVAVPVVWATIWTRYLKG